MAWRWRSGGGTLALNDLAYVGLGSNLGDRLAYLRAGLAGISALEHGCVVAVSSVYESDPVGLEDQPRFLNAALSLRTDATPVSLLRSLLHVEDGQGRERTQRWGPRTLDLDLLLYGGCVLQTDQLTLPHPRLMERCFALVPLNEIAPDLLHPVSHLSLRQATADLACADQVHRVASLQLPTTPQPPKRAKRSPRDLDRGA